MIVLTSNEDTLRISEEQQAGLLLSSNSTGLGVNDNTPAQIVIETQAGMAILTSTDYANIQTMITQAIANYFAGVSIVVMNEEDNNG